jgi:hypothetical protein
MDCASMNEENQLKAWVLFLFLLAVFAISTGAMAAINVQPTTEGYSRGSFRAPSGSFSFAPAANSGTYGATSVTSVGGKSVTMPAKMRMAANAGNYIKNGLRLNPWAIAGTLAAAWLMDQGLEYLNGQWGMAYTAYHNNYMQGHTTTNARGTWVNECGMEVSTCTVEQASEYAAVQSQSDYYISHTLNGCTSQQGGDVYVCSVKIVATWGTADHDVWLYKRADVAKPMTPEDWEALPDPTPHLAPELPYAPYVEGAPVEAPEFDFAPFVAPLGQPYTKPDGSTAQPMVSVSPNGDMVTLDTFDQPLTTPDGQPVANPLPQDTPEPVPDQKTQCDKFPATLGCASLDVPEAEALATEVRSISLIAPVSMGGSGVCPAPLTASFLGQQVEMSFDPLCQFASTLRPLVLAIAWLSAGIIFVGGVRNG